VLPTYLPLLTGPRAGGALPGCYAAVSNDCEPPLTDEHWLSEGVLRAASDDQPLRLVGLSWAQDREVVLHPPSLANKVLCKRHNHALGRLDSTARRIFGALRRYQKDLSAESTPGASEFFLASGEELERWLLKLLWGATAAKVIASGGQPVGRLRSGVDLAVLADYLFRGGSLPDEWGCYVIGYPDQPVRAAAEVAVSLQTDVDGGLAFGTANMGVVTFGFSFAPLRPEPGHEVRWHPSAVCLTDRSRTVQKVVALGWDGSPTPPCVLNLVGTVELGSSDGDPVAPPIADSPGE
jgi:hypothetical protein